jgi:hypothetical protein
VPSGVAEHIDEEIGAAVDHARVIGEIRRCIDHANQFHDAFYPAQITRLLM